MISWGGERGCFFGRGVGLVGVGLCGVREDHSPEGFLRGGGFFFLFYFWGWEGAHGVSVSLFF